VACTGDDEATPAASESPTSSGTVVATSTATSAASSTPTPADTREGSSSPTAAPDVIFCYAEKDGLVGYIRADNGRDPACQQAGFLLQTDLPSGFGVGDFVPNCLQPAEGGVTILVGHLCITDYPHTFTDDPRPAEFADGLKDGDLIPSCRAAIEDDEVVVTVGPPCLLGGEGPTAITVDVAPIEASAVCSAGLLYFSDSAQVLTRLLDVLPTAEEPAPLDDYRGDLEPLRAALVADPGNVVRGFFEPWGDQSAIVINAGIAEALDALATDAGPEAITALRAQIDDAIGWYTAGRGC
jgi:hypothetical protein